MCQPNDPTATLAADLDSDPAAETTHTARFEALRTLADGDTSTA